MKKLSPERRTLIQRLMLYGAIALFSFAVADLIIINLREKFLPNQAPPKKVANPIALQNNGSKYGVITGRNLFSSDGKIPDALTLQNDGEANDKSDTPVPSSLPLELVGTLVHSNPEKSVAAINIKTRSMSGSYMVGAEIEGMAKIEKIERGIVYFRNFNNGSLEYIEINKGNAKVNFSTAKTSTGAAKASGKEVQSVGNNSFRIKRSDLNKYLSDLNSIVMQARAIPNIDPNTGEPNGYRLVDFQPGSIFEQLGLPRGALIKTAGGQPINSPLSAMEMFNKLKTEPKVKLGVEINGTEQEFNYEIQ